MQAHRLLVHRHLVGKDGRLGEDAGRVQLGVGQHLIHFSLQTSPVFLHGLGGSLLHQGDQAFNGVRPGQDVIR